MLNKQKGAASKTNKKQKTKKKKKKKKKEKKNGPGTHWACYIDSFYFDPFGLQPPKNILFIKRYNTSQYHKKDICSLWLLLSFFH